MRSDKKRKPPEPEMRECQLLCLHAMKSGHEREAERDERGVHNKMKGKLRK